LQHPFYERQVPVILGDHVTLDAGTGACHSPGHGLVITSWSCATTWKIAIGGRRRTILPRNAAIRRRAVFDANAHIIKVLIEQGRLLKDEPHHHSYPHCWRHKTPVIFPPRPNGSSAWSGMIAQGCARGISHVD